MCYLDREIFNGMSRVIHDCFVFVLLHSHWSRKLTPFSQPIRCKTKTNQDLVAHFFQHFRQFVCFSFEFSLALNPLTPLSDQDRISPYNINTISTR